MTATLPLVMQDEFIEYNKLVRPRIVRESTNRSNIKYMVGLETGLVTLAEKAANLVRVYWPRREFSDDPKDKIIIYCQTRAEVAVLADMLECPSYTSELGSEEEKAALLLGWIANTG
jgi:superfamily II DNA helicase RecQ